MIHFSQCFNSAREDYDRMKKAQISASFSVGIEPATPAYETVTQSVSLLRCAGAVHNFFLSLIMFLIVRIGTKTTKCVANAP